MKCPEHSLLEVGLESKVKRVIKAYDLALDGHHYLVDAFPVIGVLSLSIDHLEALEDVYDIIDPPALDSKLTCALVQVEHGAALAPVKAQESAAEFAKTLFLSTVLALRLQVTICRGGVFLKFSVTRRGIFIFIVLHVTQEFFILRFFAVLRLLNPPGIHAFRIGLFVIH